MAHTHIGTRLLTEINIGGFNDEIVELTTVTSPFAVNFINIDYLEPNKLYFNFDGNLTVPETVELDNALAAHDKTDYDIIQEELDKFPDGDGSEIFYKSGTAGTSGLVTVSITEAIDEVFIRADAANVNAESRIKWLNKWAAREYQANDMVLDGEWTMIANTTTEDRAAPQPTGDPWWVFEDLLIEASVVAKQVIVGNRYTFPRAGYLNNIRIWTVIGEHYDVFMVLDPTGPSPIFNQLVQFTATIDGWSVINVSSSLLDVNAIFDVVTIVTEGDPVTTNTILSYSYQNPNNPIDPGTAIINHANKETNVLRVSKTDFTADQSAFLSTLSIGDTITGAGVVWAIQSILEQSNLFIFTVEPPIQGSPTGQQDFIFGVVTAATIKYDWNQDYWSTNNLSANGLIAVDTAYADITVNDSAYGVDIEVQEVSISDDWDVVSHSASGGSGTSPISADLISYDNTNSELTAINVQTAIDEIVHKGGDDNILLDTDGLPEGLINFYYTETRFDTSFAAKSVIDLSDVSNAGSGEIITTAERTQINDNQTAIALHITDFANPHDVLAAQVSYDNATSGLTATHVQAAIDEVQTNIPQTTTDLPEGLINFYWTETRFDVSFATKTTTNLVEGTNLYYTDQRVQDYLDNIAGLNSINVYQRDIITVITSSTYVDLIYDQFRLSGGVFTFSPLSAEITINEDGIYLISYNCSYTSSSKTCNSKTTIFVEDVESPGVWNSIPGTDAYGMHDGNEDGTQAVSKTVSFELHVGDKIKVSVQRSNGKNSVISLRDAVSLYVQKI